MPSGLLRKIKAAQADADKIHEEARRQADTTLKEADLEIKDRLYRMKNDFDAETKETIRFRNIEFNFKSEYNANELAVSLLGGKMAYPSYVILDENFNLAAAPVQSYLTPAQLLPILEQYVDQTELNDGREDKKRGSAF